MPRMLRLHRLEGPSGLQIDEVEKPEPGPGEIRVANQAFALNYGDLLLMEGQYVFDLDLPSSLCDEAAGVVDAVGAGVTQHHLGDKVSTLPFMNEGYTVSGETFLVPAEFAVPYPESLSVEEACSIWVQYLTAYYALVELAEVTPETWVLVTAGASTAGSAALELCRMLGYRTIATTRSPTQVDYIRSKGATEVVVTDGTLADRLREITAGVGVGIAYDCVGDPLLAQYAQVLAHRATIYLYGKLDPTPDVVPIVEMVRAQAILWPYSVYHHIYDEQQRERGVRFVRDAIVAGHLKPEVDRVFAFEDYRAAYEYQVAARGRRGKIVIAL